MPCLPSQGLPSLSSAASWGWLVALVLIALVFGPLAIASYRAWRAGIGVGVTIPADALRLVAGAWGAQLVVAVCFLMARGRQLAVARAP